MALIFREEWKWVDDEQIEGWVQVLLQYTNEGLQVVTPRRCGQGSRATEQGGNSGKEF